MVAFKTWRDAYIFIRDYSNFSCLNCKYGGANIDTTQEHPDSTYVYLFCKNAIAMVRLDFITVCNEWTNNQDKTLKDYPEDTPLYNLPEDVMEILEKEDDHITIEYVESLIKKNGEEA